MGQPSKRNREIAALYEREKRYTLREAIAILLKCPKLKFDASIGLSMKMSVDPRKTDQQVRGTVSLPNGTGKQTKILAFVEGDKVQEALNAGADYAGNDELLEKVAGGWTDFDAVVSTPGMMRNVGKLGKVLGPRGLMPTPKAGTVTTDVATAIKELKGGKVEFKLDKLGVINGSVGKESFSEEQLDQNIRAYVHAVWKAKPSSAKGAYVQSMVLTSTMGPGIKLDPKELAEQ